MHVLGDFCDEYLCFNQPKKNIIKELKFSYPNIYLLSWACKAPVI